MFRLFSITFCCGCLMLIGVTSSIASDASFNCKIDASVAELFTLHNQVRASSQMCGNKPQPAAKPLKWHCDLSVAAQKHAHDMQRNNFLAHRGSDGSKFTERIERAGFHWQASAENIGYSYQDTQHALRAWLGSSPHCTNIMNAQYEYFGAAKVGDYWAILFAR